MAQTAAALPFIEFEEFDRIERASECKMEYLHGATYVMAGGSPRHNLIAINCAVALGNSLPTDTCLVFSSDQHIVTPQNQANFMPDLSAVCGESLDAIPYRLTNPFLVVEVLSLSTRNHDLTNKLFEYQRIPSLRAILYIDSESLTVRLWTRPVDATWPAEPQFIQDAAGFVPLPLGTPLPMSRLYVNTGLMPS